MNFFKGVIACALVFCMTSVAQAQIQQIVTQTPAIDENGVPVKFENGELYFARVTCRYPSTAAQLTTAARSNRVKNRLQLTRKLEVYGHFIGFKGFSKVVGAALPAGTAADTVETTVADKKVAGVALPTILWQRDGKQSIVGAQRLCGTPSDPTELFFRFNESDPPAAFSFLLASSKRNADTANLLGTVLATSASLVTQIVSLLPNVDVPGLDDEADVKAFADAITNFVTLFEGSIEEPQEPRFVLGTTQIDAAVIQITIQIVDRDRWIGGALDQDDDLFLTGPARFIDNWRAFLPDSAQEGLGAPGPAAADHACTAAKTRLQAAVSADAAKPAYGLGDADAALVMLAALKRGNYAAVHAVPCLGPDLVRAAFTLSDKAAFRAAFPTLSDKTFARIGALIHEDHRFSADLVALLPDDDSSSLEPAINFLKGTSESDALAQADGLARGFTKLRRLQGTFSQAVKPIRHLRDNRRAQAWADIVATLGADVAYGAEAEFRDLAEDKRFELEDAIETTKDALAAEGLDDATKKTLETALKAAEAQLMRMRGWALEPVSSDEPSFEGATEGFASALADLGFRAFGCGVRNIASSFDATTTPEATRLAIFGHQPLGDGPIRHAHFAFLALRPPAEGETGRKARDAAMVHGYLRDAEGRAVLSRLVLRNVPEETLLLLARESVRISGGTACRRVVID